MSEEAFLRASDHLRLAHELMTEALHILDRNQSCAAVHLDYALEMLGVRHEGEGIPDYLTL